MQIITLKNLKDFKNLLYNDLSKSVEENTDKINDLENSFGSTVLYTEQYLTDEQKAQARANIGAISEYDDEVIVEEVEYTYDGNFQSDEYTWVLNGAKNKIFVKAGDIPEKGEIDLLNAYVRVKHDADTWFDYQFTITEEMLNQVIPFYGDDSITASAQQNGFTQIFYYDTRYEQGFSTLIAVCTRPGSYRVAFPEWEESLSFAEKGVYFYHGAAISNQRHVAYLSCNLVTKVSSNGEIVETSPVKYKGNEIQIFNRGICIGDSLTTGAFKYNNDKTFSSKHSYPNYLKKITGVDIVNAGVPDTRASSWYACSLDSSQNNGKWINNEWVFNDASHILETDIESSSLDYSQFDFAIIHFGIHELSVEENATVEETAEIFKISVNNIINKLKESNTGIKIFLTTFMPSRREIAHYKLLKTLESDIKEMSDSTEDVYLIDLSTYSECFINTPYVTEYSLTALGYHKMASEIAALISYTISKNLEDFKWVQFIGTDFMG